MPFSICSNIIELLNSPIALLVMNRQSSHPLENLSLRNEHLAFFRYQRMILFPVSCFRWLVLRCINKHSIYTHFSFWGSRLVAPYKGIATSLCLYFYLSFCAPVRVISVFFRNFFSNTRHFPFGNFHTSFFALNLCCKFPN